MVMLHRPGARGIGHLLLNLASPRLIPLNTGGALPGRRPQVCRALPRSPPGTAASPEPGHAVSPRGKGHRAPLR
eukprot:6894399-Prymnesium_polylepis.2